MRYEDSRESSPFNQRLFVRWNLRDKVLVLLGRTLFTRSAAGDLTARDLTPEEVCGVLQGDAGISHALVEEWVRCGGLAASFEEPRGPQPPPVTSKPPSQRG